MNLRNTILSFCSIAFLSLFASSLSANNLYWVGGQGNWTNTAKWSTSSGGAPSTSLPDENTTVIFDINSGLSAGNNVNIPGGEHSVEGFVVTGITTNFKIRFIGTNSDPTVMNIHGDLNLLTTHSMVYAGDALHRWEFHGKNTGSQEIKSSGKNLHYIRFPNDDKDYHLNGDLLVTDFISYIGGNLNTNNYNITAEEFNVLNNGSATTSQKNLTLGTSTINCDKYNAELTYGALNITGNYTLKAKTFFGAPSQTNDPTTHPKIILKDYEASSLFDNNFTCTDCLIDTLIIENSFDTKLQGSFVIEHLLEIIEPGNTIFFNVINSISNQVTVNGQVITPSVTGCDDRTAFQGYNSDIIDLHRSTGSLTINGVILKDIQAQGGANFIANNSILLGSSSGWTSTNTPSSQTYQWIGNSGINVDWDNPDNWKLANGTNNGCIPIAIDNVIIDNNAINDMRIPEGVTARCNDFLWTKSSAASLILDGNFADDAILIISGHFFLSDVTNVTANGLYELILNSNSNNEIQTNSVSLPNITLIGNSGQWKLKSDFICGFLTLESGTLITSNFNIEANKFLLMEEHPKSLFLGSSYIKVNGLLDLAPTGVFQNIFINAGTSFIECEELDYRTVTLHDIQINNTVDENIGNTQNGNNPDDILTANQLILNGSGKVTMLADITLNTLILKQDNALLHMDPNESLFINESIISEASIANPATIQSSLAGTQVSITKSIGNLCITGPINFQDIHADMNGVFHSPLGGDNGNNININFSNSSILTPLYWIGNTGSWDTKTNWSNLSGGCPVDKNPNAALRLIFDDNSFISNADIITLPVLTNCKTIDFYNTNYPANFDIQTRLNPLQVIINNANVNFSGAKMFVQSKTVLNGSANLTLDIVVGDTPKYDTPILEINDNSTVLVLSNTLLKVRQ